MAGKAKTAGGLPSIFFSFCMYVISYPQGRMMSVRQLSVLLSRILPLTITGHGAW